MGKLNNDEITAIFSNNLTAALDMRDMNPAELSREADIEKQSVYSWLKKNSFPSTKNLQTVMDVLDVSSDELLSPRTGIYYAAINLGSGDDPNYVDVPLYGSIAAGTPIEMIEADDYFPIPMAILDKYPDAFLLKVNGESMNRRIPHGCYALIDPKQKEVVDMKPYAICINGFDATIKRAHPLNNGIELIPDSTDPTFITRTFNFNDPSEEELTIIGRVVWVTMPFDYEI